MKTRNRWIRVLCLAPLALALAVLACSAEIGSSCDSPGSLDECVNGAVCTNESSAAVCRQLCLDQPDCPPGFNCNGLTGSQIKSCQPDS